MKKLSIEIKWALLHIAMYLVWMILERALGFHDEYLEKQPIVTMFVLVPSILFYVLALLQKRKKFYGGYMTYKQGFISGVVLSAIITLFTPLLQVIISLVITPDYFNKVIDYVVTHGMFTKEQAEAQFNLNNYIIQSTIWAMLFGIVITAIVAIFTIKRNRNVTF
ncbi:MAG: DUF4199 domain-containing protein [Bacteroidia bacterium]|nr:DUF4199 domain-containing protein [Bacteroidia bacterium]